MVAALGRVIESPFFRHFITGLILFNGLVLGLATSKSIMAEYGSVIGWIDNIIVAIFTVEIAMRITVHRVNFFKDPWSLFDFFVVAISLVPASEELSILRVLRVLRLFRLLTIVPQMRKVVAALVSVIPGIASVSMILFLLFYVFAIMSTQLFGEKFPEWFGTLGASFYTLFQVMTLESWSMGIARPVMEAFPHAWVFFVLFVLLATFIMVNLLIGIIVDAIFALKDEDSEDKSAPSETDELAQLRREIQELKVLMASVERKLN